jgi:endonuclease YncB( thermonuclease family)
MARSGPCARRFAIAVGGVMGLMSLPPGAVHDAITGVATVRDGDTVEIHGRPIRLYGIDAPEGRQLCHRDGRDWRCGQAAAHALADHIGRRPLTCQPRDTDRYGRPVAVCRIAGEDIGAWLVREGWALAYRRYGTDYVPDERAAKAAGRGVWSATFTPPWEWREEHRSEPAPATPGAVPGACTIKGNINRKGARLYHLPGDRGYAETRIDPAHGERWFCSEAEARAAGWRRSR